MSPFDLTAAELALIVAAAVGAGTAIVVRALDRRALARHGRTARQLLLVLDRAQRAGPPPTAEELGDAAGVRSSARVRRALTLLEAIGLLTGDDARIVITDEHIWIERRLHLSSAGRAAVHTLHSPLDTEHPTPAGADAGDAIRRARAGRPPGPP